MHVHVRLLSQDSTFDLFNFFPTFFSKIWVAKLGVRLICECGLYAGVYGILEIRKKIHWQLDHQKNSSGIGPWFYPFQYGGQKYKSCSCISPLVIFGFVTLVLSSDTITKKESLFLSVYHTVWMLHKAKTARLVITLYQHITDKLPTSYRHITNCRPFVGQLSADW